jgi:lipopolysaccharide exporter
MRFLRNILLTRILLPKDFGSVAIILAFGALFESLTEIGVKESVIRDPNGEDPLFLNGAWATSVVRCAGIYGLVFVLAPLMAQFYHQPDLVPITRIALVSILFRGLVNPKVYLLERKIQFSRYALIMNGGGTIALLCTIVMGYMLGSRMALVYGLVLEGFVVLVLSFALCPFLPRMVFNRDYIKSLMKFARGYLGLPILAFIYMRVDVFVVRRLLPESVTGLYSMAASLSQVMSLVVSRVIYPIIMPAFAEMNKDPKRIGSSLVTINLVMCIICLPAAAFAAICGRSILSILYTAQYAAMTAVFGALLFADALRVLNMPVVSLYLAVGKPHLLRAFSAVRAGILVVSIYPATLFFGPFGAACAVLLAMGISHVFQVIMLKASIHMALRPYFTAYCLGAALCLPVVVARFLLPSFFRSSPIEAIGLGAAAVVLSWALAFMIYSKWGHARRFFLSSK